MLNLLVYNVCGAKGGAQGVCQVMSTGGDEVAAQAVDMYETAAGLGHRDSIRALCVYYVSGIRGLCSTLVVDHDNIKFLDSSENAPHGQKQVYEFLERAARLGCM